MKTLNEFLECKVDFYSYEDGKFVYTYKSNGKDVQIEVNIVDGGDDIEFHVGGKSIGLNTDVDFIGCEDLEDCCLVIAKRVVKDNDSEVKTTFFNDEGETLTEVSYDKTLNKNLEYETDEDNSWTLYLNCGSPFGMVHSFEFWVVEEENVDKVIDLLGDGEVDELYDYISDDSDLIEVYNLWGDDEHERVYYEVLDENNYEVDSG